MPTRSRRLPKKVRRRLAVVAAALLALAAGGAWLGHLVAPVSTRHRAVLVRVGAGTSTSAVAERLERRGLIRSARVFGWYAVATGYAGRIKAGEYLLRPDMSAHDMLARMARGGSDLTDLTVTIPEGWTVKQIAGALVSRGVLRSDEAFLRIARSPHPPLRAPFALPRAGLEGYLFPDTYRFPPDSQPEQVAQRMLDNFEERFRRPDAASIARSGRSLNAIVTIASLVEREAQVERDRKAIAGVIDNRLRRHMRLQIDASLDYARGRHLTRVLYRDLAVDSPYNTYRYAGLPPGPIANPGLPSLRAALSTARHPYLFYVAAPDGSHVFTRTEAEHLRQVARMRAMRRTTAGGANG